MNPKKLELLITREMPFGKYKGRIIADLPGPYLTGSPAKVSPTASWAGCWP